MPPPTPSSTPSASSCCTTRSRLAPSAPRSGNLLGAAVRAHQHQVGEVGAGDQQHQRDRAEQDQERRPRVAHQVVLQRHDQRAPVLVVGGILRGQAQRDRCQIGLRPLDAARPASASRWRDSCDCRGRRDRRPSTASGSHTWTSSRNDGMRNDTDDRVRARDSAARVWPTSRGSAPNRVRQKLSLSSACPARRHDPPRAVNPRPSDRRRAPRIGRKLDDPRMVETASGSPRPVIVRAAAAIDGHASNDWLCASQSRKLAGESAKIVDPGEQSSAAACATAA